METTTVQNPSLSGQVLFYQQPELLSREAHGSLGVNRSETAFAFASGANVVPLTVPEFGPASLCYPVIFAGEQYNPLAVMGLSDGQNLFISPEGVLEPDAYMPAFIRRYPFVLASAADDAERMLVCIDRSYKNISENPELPFFDNGEPSEYTKNSIEFLNQFQTQVQLTSSFTQMLQELGLFEPRTTTFTPRNADGTTGEPQKIAEYFAVSEEKLKALPADKLVELRDNGALQQIYAHLNSLFGWDRLTARVLSRAAAQQPQPANS
jgi:hypothetical protein